MGLSEINSKNYELILSKVKYTGLTPVTDSPGLPCSVNANNIKSEIKQQHKYLSEVEIDEIIIKYKTGKSTYELAKEYGCHRYTISKRLKEAELKYRIEWLEGIASGAYASALLRMAQTSEIAEALGISVDSVRRCLKENGVELRHSSEYARR